MNDKRPDPDLLLAQVRQSEARALRGHLTIFFGANAGVGKSYSMLEAAQRRRAEGVDVVVGYVELHGRHETERLLAGLEQLPPLVMNFGTTTRREFDLDGALARKPGLLLVDELAHTNISGGDPPPRHEKRWQDIQELLDAGIDVFTTVNVQHLESLSDVVWQITGVRQLETLPDRVFDEADEVKLVDITPDDLLQRLREGRVYISQQAERALENFFRKGNLIALRELALRKTADRVDRAMRDYRQEKAVRGAWAARERVLVAVGPDAQAERLVRAGKRTADRLDAEWLVVFVETPDLLRLSEQERNRRIAILRLAESLGAEADHARRLIGGGRAARLRAHPQCHAHPGRRFQSPALAAHCSARRPPISWFDTSRDIDVLVIARNVADRPAAPGNAPDTVLLDRFRQATLAALSARAVLATLAATGVCWVFHGLYPRLGQANLVMIYLLTTALVAVYGGRRAAILSSVLGVAAFDFMFVPPQFTLCGQRRPVLHYLRGHADRRADHRQSQCQRAPAGAHRRLSRAAHGAALCDEPAARDGTRPRRNGRGGGAPCEPGVRQPCGAAVRRRAGPRRLSARAVCSTCPIPAPTSGSRNGCSIIASPPGMGTDTLSGSAGLYLPLAGGERAFGVLAVLPENPRRVTLPEQFRLLETFAAQIGLALERADFAAHAQAAEVRAETEAIRNALLASISHDLRTPLATIAGGAATLAGNLDALSDADRRALASSVSEEATRMSERITTLLDLVRLETGAIQPRFDLYALDEIVGSVLHRLEQRLRRHRVRIELPESLPLLRIDGRLIEQVLENLLDNAAKYTPAGSEIRISAQLLSRQVEVSIEDDGPGLATADPEILFEKFQRGAPEGAVGGIGLGLAICRTILGLHKGRIWAENRAPHGAAFRFTVPLPSIAPETAVQPVSSELPTLQ